ncbi:hypothetical protein GCM10010201_09030 [Pilimelia columellifera subsp. columellifera]|uniref:Uncharacterized protein n=1 Tax=Pilimelia columellifera subsp. columellifera TaxID=706583 RepID=A0ABP6AH55_9ACTN
MSMSTLPIALPDLAGSETVNSDELQPWPAPETEPSFDFEAEWDYYAAREGQ